MKIVLSAKFSARLSMASVGVFMFALPVSGQTLNEALASAYLKNPGLLAARADLRSKDEAVPQALASWRPNVAMTADIARSHTHLNTRSANRDQMQSPRNMSLDVTQPLFRGFRSSAGVTKAELSVNSTRATLIGKEQDVLLSAVTAFMSVVQDEAKLDLKINNEQVLKRQLEATQDRFRVGEITRTDVSQAEARVAGAAADRIQFEGNLNNSRSNYLKVIGQKPGKLLAPAALSIALTSLENTIEAAVEEHPDIISQRYLEQSARINIKSVRGELLPTVNLAGKLSRAWESSSNDDQKTTGQMKLSLSIPLYQKGSVYSRLRAAKQSARQSFQKLEETRRSVTEAAAKAWESLQTAKARIKSYSAQIEAAKIALEGVQREAAVGSRTVLDVLDAEQELLDAKISLVGANRDKVVASFQLKEATGQLTAKLLELPVQRYSPSKHYKKIRSKWLGSE
ncbi:TolC family outer membrane protein [Gammaproteobacteria bacterium]|nr:TolC family outer membrane protein [Gammaproteobacteria bacterium]